MCDRSKKTAALILIPAALLLPIMLFRTTAGKEYRTSGSVAWVLKKIGTEQNGNVRVNEADAAELESLYGIGPAYSERIIEERKKNGPFYYPEDLTADTGYI